MLYIYITFNLFKSSYLSLNYDVGHYVSIGSAVLSSYCTQRTPGFTGIQTFERDSQIELSLLDVQSRVLGVRL